MPVPDAELEARLERHLQEWLGAWPPAGPLTVVGHDLRTRPGWNGAVFPVVGVTSPEGTVVSVPPGVAEAARDVGPDLDEVGRVLPGLVGRPASRLGSGVFRWCRRLLAPEPWAPAGVGVWLPTDDDRVPGWLAPFNGEVLVHLDPAGRYGGGVGRKRHDDFGQEIAVAVEECLRGRGIARRLVAEAARRIAEEGAVATYLHADANLASARVAEAAGFPDRGWRIIGLPVAS